MEEPWFPPGFDVPAGRAPVPSRPEDQLSRLADRQHGIVTRKQLQALGFTSDRIRGRVRRGLLHRLDAGVYVVGRHSTDAAGTRMAAVLGSGRGALLADLSAAAHAGAKVRAPRKVHVIVPPGRLVDRKGVLARSAVVLPHERTLLDGIPAATMPRVLLDVAAHRDRRTLEDLWHEAVYRRLLDLPGIARVLQDHHGEPGTVALRELYERRLRAFGDVANRMEAEMRDILREAGLPEPRANERMCLEGVWLKPDLYVAERRLAIETDGRDGHDDPERQVSDAERDRLYRRAGLIPCRYGWWQVHYERSRVLHDFVGFERAWERTRGRWTRETPEPSLGVSRRAT